MYKKYHGLGNDFIIGMYEGGVDYSNLAIKCCDRHSGIGADGLILAKEDNGEMNMVLYNSDGSLAPMCGNGMRCFAYYLVQEGLVKEDEFIVNTLGGKVRVKVESKKPFYCRVNLGKPNYSSKILDIDTEQETFLDQYIELSNHDKVEVNAIYMTTHHLVTIVPSLDEAINSSLAKELGENKIFTKGINVNLVEIIDRDNVRMKTYERGAGWTLACGTGASSAYAILRRKNLCNEVITINLERGQLKISSDSDNNIIMEGEAKEIAQIELIEI